MFSFLFGFQIFITILIALVIVFQKSSSDGIVTSNIGGTIPSSSQASFISKLTIFLICVFMINSLFLAKNSINEYKHSKSIITSLENKTLENKSPDVETNEENIAVPKME